jgi:hypothetical protein
VKWEGIIIVAMVSPRCWPAQNDSSNGSRFPMSSRIPLCDARAARR